jgi:alkanesulfonate monooxygenase SsuD/methylene tetrahydromethanopterin reductase-like flavin-dependent oxidoreductase (luciferase family)
VKPAVYFGWHTHGWQDLLALTRRAEALGYDAVFVDGDVSMLQKRPEADCLDGWTTTVALLAATERIAIGSLRLVHHWNAARLAQAAASAARIAPGRLRFGAGVGDWPVDARFGLDFPPVRERVTWLGETLDAVRALWRGQPVTRDGRYVKLDGARLQPAPGHTIPISIAARRPRMLALVAEHADVWDVNLPPLRKPVADAAERLAAACSARGRDPAEIGRSQLLFARPGAAPGEALAEFRRFNPWFREFSDSELTPQLIYGEPAACRTQLERLSSELGLSQPVIDASGLPAEAAERLLEALSPAE